MLGLFGTKITDKLTVDVHSHLLPGIDDGVKTVEESLSVLAVLESAGIKKVITTPHIYQEYYPNTPDVIREKLDAVRKALSDSPLQIELEAAAEYYTDEHFLRLLENNREILPFGESHILFETAFINKPVILDQVIFKIQANGYTPVLAHPERYAYVVEQREILYQLKEKGVLLQVNARSFTGKYGAGVKKTAEWMLKNELTDLLGSDIHNLRHAQSFVEFTNSRVYGKLMKLPLLNKTLQ